MNKCPECNEGNKTAESLYKDKVCEKCKHFEKFRKLNKNPNININRFDSPTADSFSINKPKEDDNYQLN